MKKLLSVLLLLATLLSAFAACKNDKPAPEASTESEEVAVPDLLLFSEGKTDFRIIYNEMEMAKNTNVETKLKDLESSFQEHTGIKLKKTASTKYTYDANAYEIYIGNTGTEETKAASKDLRLTDYRIVRNGNRH